MYVRAAGIAIPVVLGASAARAADAVAPVPGLGLQLGAALVVLLAVLIAMSVAAKLAIVFGLVPRRPETGLQALVHAMANFVGGLTRARPRRRDDAS